MLGEFQACLGPGWSPEGTAFGVVEGFKPRFGPARSPKEGTGDEVVLEFKPWLRPACFPEEVASCAQSNNMK